MKELQRNEIQVAISLLSEAETPAEAVAAWAFLNAHHPGMSAMVVLKSYQKSAVPRSVRKYLAEPHNCLVPYFSSEHLYFLDEELVSKMFRNNEFRFPIDYTLMFDTNVASYVNKVIRGEPLGAIQGKVVSLLDDLLHDDLNFDHFFYMQENVKNVYRKIETSRRSKLEFWRSLDKKFRNNMVSLQLFSSVDCKHYRRTSSPKLNFTYRQAARNAVEFCYDFYASESGREHITNFVLQQRVILLHLVGIVKIQLSSRKSAKNKMREYFRYVHETVGAYFDREAIVAHKYFSDSNNVTIFGKIQKGGSKLRLLKHLDNIAWDLAAPRFMEKMIVDKGDGRYFVPMFLTFDSSLRELLRLYPVKGVIYRPDGSSFIPFPAINTWAYFEEHGCSSDLDWLHGEAARSERRARAKPTRVNVHELIQREYKSLRQVI